MSIQRYVAFHSFIREGQSLLSIGFHERPVTIVCYKYTKVDKVNF